MPYIAWDKGQHCTSREKLGPAYAGKHCEKIGDKKGNQEAPPWQRGLQLVDTNQSNNDGNYEDRAVPPLRHIVVSGHQLVVRVEVGILKFLLSPSTNVLVEVEVPVLGRQVSLDVVDLESLENSLHDRPVPEEHVREGGRDGEILYSS